jgi:hypothetical protein
MPYAERGHYGGQRFRYGRNFLVKFPPAAERFVERDIGDHDS